MMNDNKKLRDAAENCAVENYAEKSGSENGLTELLLGLEALGFDKASQTPGISAETQKNMLLAPETVKAAKTPTLITRVQEFALKAGQTLGQVLDFPTRHMPGAKGHIPTLDA